MEEIARQEVAVEEVAMKRYCSCGRAIWVVFRHDGKVRIPALYDGGSNTVWMPITRCPGCGAELAPDHLEDYPLALREEPIESISA